MSSIQIIVGSMLGGTEYVAEACEETLISLDHEVTVHLNPDFDTIINDTFSIKSEQKTDDKLSQKPLWIICTSTHGAGEYPDNIQEFVSKLTNCDQDLSTVEFLTIAMGDSNYDTFCKAGKDISALLISKGCSEVLPMKTLDMNEDIDPEELAQVWIQSNNDRL